MTSTLLFALVGVFCVVLSCFGVLHYEAMNSHQTDVALMDQVVWTTLHGHFMRTTLQGQGIDTMLAFHVEPIMALISPLYLLIPSPAVLVVLQTVGFGLSAIPLALWARKRLDSGAVALLVALAFLLNPVVANANDLLFEQIPLAVPFLAFAFYFQLQRHWKPFFVLLLLALAVREEIAFVAIGMGLYALLVQRHRIGWVVVLTAATWGLVCLAVIIPHFNAGRGLYWAQSFAYLDAGDSPLAIAGAAIRHPLAVIRHMLSEPRPQWVVSLFVPVAFLPVAGWRVAWLALPTLGYLLLGDGYYDPNSWYPSPMLPFLFFGAIEGISVLRRFVPSLLSAGVMAASALVAFYHLVAVQPSRLFDTRAYVITPHNQAAKAMFATIPAEASVSATPQIVAHLSHRMNVSIFPELLIPHDVFAIDFLGWRGWHGYPAIYDEYDQALRRVLRDPAYGAFYEGDGLLLLRRGIYPAATGRSLQVRLGKDIQLLGWDGPAEARPGQPLTVHLRWKTEASLDRQYTVSLQFGNDGNGKLAQRDSWPWDGYFPTVEWPVGREIDDPQTVMLPPSLAPGQYTLFVSLYALENGQARPLTTDSGQSGVTLGPFTVVN